MKRFRLHAWTEIISHTKNIIIYGQHDNPDCFLNYLNEKVEQFSANGKLPFVMCDFNVNLLNFLRTIYKQLELALTRLV